MNILFFQAAMVVYLLSAVGYITYIFKPELKQIAAALTLDRLCGPYASCRIFFSSLG